MNYHVRWSQSATNELSEIWLSAEPEVRREITQASGELDRELRHEPYAASESRDEGRRVTFSAPLAVEFRVSDDDRLVSVLQVWSFRRGSR